MESPTYRVLPALRGWKVYAEDIGRVLSLHEHKADAIALAHMLARDGLHLVVVHGDDGELLGEVA